MAKAKQNASTTVRALIEVSITPQKDLGFDSIAERIYSYPQVKSCYLLSGGFDLLVVVEGESIHTVADFVAAKLSSMANVRQTATHFLLSPLRSLRFVSLPSCVARAACSSRNIHSAQPESEILVSPGSPTRSLKRCSSKSLAFSWCDMSEMR